jgi:hypothetical protein
MSADIIALRRKVPPGHDAAAESVEVDRLMVACRAILAMERQGHRFSVPPIRLLADIAEQTLWGRL